MAPTLTQLNTWFTWVASSTTCHSQQGSWQPLVRSQLILWETVKESMAESLAPPLHKDPCLQSRRRSHPPVRCRGLSSLSEADQATWAVSPTLPALHPWHQMVRLRVKWRSLQESQPAQHRVHLAAGAAALGWPRHKDERRLHAQSSLLQQAPRRKAWPWRSRKTLQRPAEETSCTGGNQPSDMAAGGLRPRQLALISDKSKSEAERHKAAKERLRRQKERAAFQPRSAQTFVCPKCSRVCASRIGVYNHRRARRNWP